MSLKNQHHLFGLPENVHYLNCAYQGPLLKSSSRVGVDALTRKETPYVFEVSDYFNPSEEVKKLFAKIIHCDNPQRIALIPAASYGLANAAANCPVRQGQKIILLEGQFPSNYYIWKRLAAKTKGTLVVVRPSSAQRSGESWNRNVLSAIDSSAAVVAMPHVFWADGTLFDIEEIGRRCREVGCRFVIDGSQSIGALPFDVKKVQPDALIVAGYKWLLGPYASGVAYYGPSMDDGEPIEENWMNRVDSDKFEALVDYEDPYRPFAYRYAMGESWNFTNAVMLIDSLTQILKWGVGNIQEYCRKLFSGAVEELRGLGCSIEPPEHRAHHLFGVRPDKRVSPTELVTVLKKKKVFVSLRGTSVRISPHLYNTAGDVEALVEAIREVRG